MGEKELKKLYKGTVAGPYIGHFRVRIGNYNRDVSFPIDLDQAAFDFLYDLRRYFQQQNTEFWINIEEE